MPKKVVLPDLSVEEIAERFGIARSTAYRWIRYGMPSYEIRFGFRKYRRVNLEDARAWTKERRMIIPSEVEDHD